jgi:hypothetical protein
MKLILLGHVCDCVFAAFNYNLGAAKAIYLINSFGLGCAFRGGAVWLQCCGCAVKFTAQRFFSELSIHSHTQHRANNRRRQKLRAALHPQ